MKITQNVSTELNVRQDSPGNRKAMEHSGTVSGATVLADRYTPGSLADGPEMPGVDTVSLNSAQPLSDPAGTLPPKLAGLKLAINNGTYQVSSSALANAMIQRAFVESTPDSYKSTDKWLA